ncbi:hypothetical protein D3C76_1814570 [compost metagenome]
MTAAEMPVITIHRRLPERNASSAVVSEIAVCKLGKQLFSPDNARYSLSKLGKASSITKRTPAGA